VTGQVLCIIPGPSKVVRERPAGDKWCFGCRKHLSYTWQLLDYEDPDWIGHYPVAVLRCSGCGKDRTRFPS
jgi:hypothetical protein